MLVFHAEGNIEGGINQDGIDYYNKLINDLIENGKLVVQDGIYIQPELSSKLMVQWYIYCICRIKSPCDTLSLGCPTSTRR